jgi:hypothetical protein
LRLIRGEDVEIKEVKSGISKLNILTVILIVLFIITLLLGPERICKLIYPAPLKLYHETLGNEVKDLREQKLGVGHIINFQYKENRRSLGELYSLTDVKFIPEDKAITIWKGEDKIETWNDDTALIENMQRFRIKFIMPVPDNKALQGQTIKGTLHFKLSYPILIKFTAKKSITHSEIWEKPVSIHIFSKNDLNRLSQLKSKMMKIWITCLAFFFLPILLLSANPIQKYIKTHQKKIE